VTPPRTKPKSSVPGMMAPVEVQLASDVLAAQLRSRILEGELPAGTQLPVERELAEQTGLSRTVVREALKMLAREGLVRTRAGRNGGTIVIRPTVSSIVRSLDQYAQVGDVELVSLLEARELLEPVCAGLAAERRTEEQLDELEEIHERLRRAVGERGAFDPENIRWHIAVARAGGNDLLASFVEGLAGVRGAGTEDRYLTTAMMAEIEMAHRAVLRAIQDGDPDAARRRMHRHLHAFTAGTQHEAHLDAERQPA
jgi:GntR family transcriptional regulator, transcriptional repressor for pyruvate dehydrogenase complex